jgi:pimeloyl-ACP methyl ester carboxylesterase
VRAAKLVAALLPLAASAAGCGPPADPGLSRPRSVAVTPFEQRDVVVGGLRLRYVDEGPRDARALLLLPGHTSRIEDYDDLVPALAQRYRVLLPDLPGKGYSDKPVRRYTLAFYEETAAAFLDALGVARLDVVGGSLGANLALRLARRYPERFERVVGWAPGGAWEARPWLGRLVARAECCYPIFRAALRIQSGYWYSDRYAGREAALRDKFAHYDEVMGPGFVAMYVGMAADSISTSLFDVAPQIRQPVLLLVGDLDTGADVGTGIRRLERLLPDAELRVFPGAGHSLVAEVPELGAVILEFLERERQRAPSAGRR